MARGFFSKLFGQPEEEPAPMATTGPLGLSVGRAVEIDFTHLRLAGEALSLPAPVSDTFIISGYGSVDLGGGSTVHRYYDDDNTMLQVLTEHGMGDESIREITYYRPWDSYVPANRAEWLEWTGHQGRVGAPTFDADGVVFRRLWNPDTPGRIEPVEFVEDVETEDSVRSIHQKVMAYRRDAGDLVEYLLVSVERPLDLGRDEGSIEFMIGYDVHRQDIRII